MNQSGLFGTISNVLGFGALINKQPLPVVPQEGIDNDSTQAISIHYTDEQLEDLAKNWKHKYDGYYSSIGERVKNNKIYLRGDQIQSFTQWKSNIPFDEMPPIYNLTYECMEIAAPMATKALPTPVVLFDDQNTEVCKLLADDIMEIAGKNNLKFKLENALRDRYTNFIGVLKVYYNVFLKKIIIDKINPLDILVDPHANMVNGIADGEYVGQYVKIPAETAYEKFPDKKDVIDRFIGKDEKNKLVYIEWWTNRLVFATCQGKLLYKMRNPYWNYKEEKETVDEFGNPLKVEAQKPNHLPMPPIPFIFININNDGTQPHDTTTELEQGIPLQHAFDQVMYQINKNASRCNGYAVSKGMPKESTADMAGAAWNGGVIALPEDANADFKIVAGTPLPSFMYEHKMSIEEGMRNLWGVRGSSAQGVLGEQTVRGKILMQGSDGGRMDTVIKRLELTCTNIYNLIHQLQCVIEDIKYTGFEIYAKEGSMIPKDTMTQRNEAVDLWKDAAITPKELYKRLDFANPEVAAEEFVMYTLDPTTQLSPELQQQVMQKKAIEMENAAARQMEGQEDVQEGGEKVNPTDTGQEGGVNPQLSTDLQIQK